MTQLQALLGEDGVRWAIWIGLGLATLLALLLIAFIVKRIFAPAFNINTAPDRRGRPPRLGVTDFFNLDRAGRRLVIVRRDNVEHLVLVGGPNDILIESNIIRNARQDVPVVDSTGRPTVQSRSTDLVPNDPPVVEVQPKGRPARTEAATIEAPQLDLPKASPQSETSPAAASFAEIIATRSEPRRQDTVVPPTPVATVRITSQPDAVLRAPPERMVPPQIDPAPATVAPPPPGPTVVPMRAVLPPAAPRLAPQMAPQTASAADERRGWPSARQIPQGEKLDAKPAEKRVEPNGSVSGSPSSDTQDIEPLRSPAPADFGPATEGTLPPETPPPPARRASFEDVSKRLQEALRRPQPLASSAVVTSNARASVNTGAIKPASLGVPKPATQEATGRDPAEAVTSMGAPPSNGTILQPARQDDEHVSEARAQRSSTDLAAAQMEELDLEQEMARLLGRVPGAKS